VVEWIIHQGNVTKKTLPQNTRWYPLGKEAASTSLKIKRLSINCPIARLEGAVNEERLSVLLVLEVAFIAAKAWEVIAVSQSVQHQNAPVGARVFF
jgi:hypothetical protein